MSQIGSFERIARAWTRLSEWWDNLTLTRRFTFFASQVLLVGMLALGAWVSKGVHDQVVQAAAAAAALFSDDLIEPRVQELKDGPALSRENRLALDELLSRPVAGKAIISIKIWYGDTIVHSNYPDLIGKTFPPDHEREQAWQGRIAANIEMPKGAAHVHEAALGRPVLEVNAPIRERGTNRIIAVAETYEVAPALPAELKKAQLEAWTIIGLTTGLVWLLLFSIVRGGAQTIARQRNNLEAKIGELMGLLDENQALRKRAHDANQRATEMMERHLRKLSADLHDGPVQLLGMSVLRLDTLADVLAKASKDTASEAREDINAVRDALRESLDEIRNVSTGLAPPEIEALTLHETIDMAVQRHQRRTGTKVRCTTSELPQQVPYALRTCVYRFIQEGLNNAFRHAKGSGQAVISRHDGSIFEVVIQDSGPGFNMASPVHEIGTQGLFGLRSRIEALGGHFEIVSTSDGTRLIARFDVHDTTSKNDLEYAHG